MVAAGRGTIVNLTSVNAFLADPAVIDHCAAIAAPAIFTKALDNVIRPDFMIDGGLVKTT